MALPTRKNEINYTADLPSGKQAEYRPWKVKDEKDLLFAVEGLEDRDETLKYVLNILNQCLKEGEIQKLSPVDILAFAIDCYKRSKGNEVEIHYTCPHCEVRGTDPMIMNLNEAVTVKPFSEEPVEIGDYVFTFEEISYLEQEALVKKYKDSVRKYKFFHLLKSLKSVIHEGESFNHFTDKEAEDFFDAMDIKEFEELAKRFGEIYSDIFIAQSTECLACKGKITVYIKDIVDFFV